MKHILKYILATVVIGTTVGCDKKLDLFPTNDITAETVFSTPAGYKQALAKVYATMAVEGTPTRDIPSEIVSDEGNTGFFRQFWYLQCLSTDEAGWTYFNNTDPIGIHQMTWSPSTLAVSGAYYRGFYNITVCNNYIKESSDENLGKRNISGADAANIKLYKAEARFLRAFNYWVLMDLFGNVPFVDETLQIGAGTLPRQISRKDLFTFIENELKALESDLAAPRTNEYGRIDKAAAWSLLARMYLNAGIYTGVPRYTDAITYSKKVIDAGYTLHPKYKELMLADNHLITSEFIWTIRYDGVRTQTYGGTTMLAHGPADGTFNETQRSLVYKDSSGTNESWNCIRVTEQFSDKFDTTKDIRGQFWVTGQTKTMDVLIGDGTKGWSSTKFRNKTRSGAKGSDVNGVFVDIDMPIFRLPEQYLIYAEAVLRGGTGGDNATALSYLRQLAVRARPLDANAANFAELTLPYIIDERARELFWEGHRRTDLIRFDMFTTGTYLWAWKGGVRSGTAVDPKYKLYPIPATDLSSNPNIVQNPGY